MCGMVGMMGPGVVKEDLEFLKQLAYTCGLRGTDGTGMVQGFINNSFKRVITEKDDIDVNFFRDHHAYGKNGNRDLFDRTTDNLFMVHCRAATLGGVSVNNTHPFEFDNIIGMHNGTLLDKRYHDISWVKEKRCQKTDSELLFKDINNRGIIKVLSELDDKSDAYALIIYNKINGTLDFVRNDKRPLFVCANKKRNVTYWASEDIMLEFIAKRMGKNFEITEPCYFKPGLIYTVRPNQSRVGDLPDWEETTWIRPPPEKTRIISANEQNFIKPEQRKLSRKERKLQQQVASRIANEAKRMAELNKSNVVALVKPAQEHENATTEVKKRDQEVLKFLRENKSRVYDKPCKLCGENISLVDSWYARNADHPEGDICSSCTDLKEKVQVH